MKQANRMVGASAISAVMLIGLSAPPAQAGYVVTLEQVGGDVVATGSGAIDLTGLSLDINFSGLASMIPSIGQILTGPALPDSSNIDVYTGITPITGPANFGSGPGALANSGNGDIVGVHGFFGEIVVPGGYVSGGSLSDTSSYDARTFSSLGVTPGRYEWTWGSGANQNFTLVIGTVPEPSTWAMMLLGFAGLGLAGWRHRRTACNV
jgi:hypothetical protein